jgi:hypothetical protein
MNSKMISRPNFKLKQGGFAVGYIFLAIAAMAALAIGVSRMSGDSSVNVSAQEASVTASTLASQGGKLKTDFTVLAQKAGANTWTEFGSFKGKGALGTGAVASFSGPGTTDRTTWPVGPKGVNGNLTWKTSIGAGSGATAEVILGYTTADVPSAVCDLYNANVRGAATQVIDATLAGAFTETPAGNAFDLGVDPIVAAGNQGDGCFKAASGGVGRIVVGIR